MASPTNDYENQILVKRKSSARVLTLNRPKKLNALTPFYEYCSCNFLQNSLKTRNTKECRLLEFFQEDERNSDVKLILMKREKSWVEQKYDWICNMIHLQRESGLFDFWHVL